MARLNITQKFIIYVMLFSVIPLVVVGAIGVTTATNLLQQENQTYTQQLVQEEVEYLELQQNQIESLIANISSVETIRDTLQDETLAADNFTRLTTQAQIGYILNGYISIQNLISIDIFTVAGTHYTVGETLVTENIRTELRDAIFAEALATDRNVVWIGIEPNINLASQRDQVLTAANIMYQFDHNTREREALAMILVNYDLQAIADHLAPQNLGKDSYMVMLDGKGRYIYHPDAKLLGTLAPEVLRSLTPKGNAPQTTIQTLANEKTAISYAYSESGWMVASLVPVSTFTAQTNGIRNTVLVALLVSLLFVVLLAYLYNRSLVAPIRQLTHSFQVLQSEAGITVAPLQPTTQDEVGELIQWFNRYLDNLTDKRRADAEREELIGELRIARDQAQESARLKSEFLATMSHELRTPLNAILGFTSVIRDEMGEEADDQIKHMLDRVHVNSVRLLDLINDVLDLSRIESGRMVLATRVFSPYKLLEQWQNQLGVLAQQKKLTIQKEIDPKLPQSLYGDEHALTKIATNLIGNAIKFTHQGGIHIKITCQETTWGIEVSDTGIGIPPEAHALIFEEFRQVDQSSKRQYGGTGLGLAIVRRLVEAMNGTIQLHSEMGVGSTFTITLPLIEKQPASEEPNK